jgi:hypothetical protein
MDEGDNRPPTDADKAPTDEDKKRVSRKGKRSFDEHRSDNDGFLNLVPRSQRALPIHMRKSFLAESEQAMKKIRSKTKTWEEASMDPKAPKQIPEPTENNSDIDRKGRDR